MKTDIGIIAAMQIEIDGIISLLTETETENVSGMDFVSGILRGKRVVAVKCGIGKVFAAVCTQTMILKYSPGCIINTGVAGALSKDLSCLDIVVADSVVQHDMDTSPLGDPKGMISGINMVKIPADKVVSDTLATSVTAAADNNSRLYRGIIASGDKFVAYAGEKQYISELFGACACEMEGAAIGQTAYINGIPFGVIRAISDNGDSAADSAMDFAAFAKKAAGLCIRAVEDFAARYNI